MTAHEIDPSSSSSLLLQLPITIRLAVQADISKLEWYGQYLHFRAVFRRTFRDQQHGKRWMLVADCNGFPVGQVFVLRTAGDLHIADGSARAYLYSLRVMEMFRGSGIGTHLIEHAERRLLEDGFAWTTIAAAKHNGRARDLYEKLGYVVFTEDAGDWSYLDHRGVVRYVHEPCWILEKRLL